MSDGKSSPSSHSPLNRALLLAQIEGDAWADAASAALGVNRTDFACLRALSLEESCTSGRLAEVTGLTSGAVTGVVDRLEKGQFVQRFSDPDDRRKVLLRLSEVRAPQLSVILSGVAASDSDPDVTRFLQERAAALRRETERLRASQPEGARTSEGVIAFPRGGLGAARFEVAGGAMDLAVSAGPLEEDLVRAELSGPPVRITEQAGNVRLAHRGISRQKPQGSVQLNADVHWAVRVSGGRNRLSFDLSAARVSDVEVEGGDGKLRFRFGPLAETVPVRVNGGASELLIERPPDVLVEVVAKGRVSKLTVDGVDRGALTMDTWTSEGAGPGRVRVHVRGGLNKVAIA